MTQLRLMILFSGMLLMGQSWSQETPYLIISQKLDFGELLGLTGTCHLDAETKEVTDLGGSFCPFIYQRYAEPAHYIIVADPGSQVEFRINTYSNLSNGLNYIPEGIYKVSGLSDVPMLINQFQTINSGSTGVINIRMGGTLTTSRAQSFNTNFLIEIVDGISFEHVP